MNKLNKIFNTSTLNAIKALMTEENKFLNHLISVMNTILINHENALKENNFDNLVWLEASYLHQHQNEFKQSAAYIKIQLNSYNYIVKPFNHYLFSSTLNHVLNIKTQETKTIIDEILHTFEQEKGTEVKKRNHFYNLILLAKIHQTYPNNILTTVFIENSSLNQSKINRNQFKIFQALIAELNYIGTQKLILKMIHFDILPPMYQQICQRVNGEEYQNIELVKTIHYSNKRLFDWYRSYIRQLPIFIKFLDATFKDETKKPNTYKNLVRQYPDLKIFKQNSDIENYYHNLKK